MNRNQNNEQKFDNFIFIKNFKFIDSINKIESKMSNHI